MADVCDVPVISSVCNVAGDAAGALVSAPFDWLAQGMGHAAGWMFEAVWRVFDSTTMVDVTSSQFTVDGGITVGPRHSWDDTAGGPILDALGISPEQAEQMAEAMKAQQG